MKRSTLAVMILAAGSLGASASGSGYDYLAIERSNGAAQTLSAIGLTLTFADGKLTATNGTEKAVVALSDLNRMYFTDTQSTDAATTSIQRIDTSTNNDTQSADAVYDLSGRQIGNGKSINGSSSKGVYIVKKNGKTKKIQVK